MQKWKWKINRKYQTNKKLIYVIIIIKIYNIIKNYNSISIK